MTNIKLNKRQQSIVLSANNLKNASREAVRQFELVLLEYWNIGGEVGRSCNPEDIQFFLNAYKRNTHWCNAARLLLKQYAPVDVKKKGDGYTVTNKKNITKKAKIAFRAEVRKLIALELNTLLHHPSIKTDIAYDWNNRRAGLKRQLEEAVKNNVSIEEIMSTVNEVFKAA